MRRCWIRGGGDGGNIGESSLLRRGGGGGYHENETGPPLHDNEASPGDVLLASAQNAVDDGAQEVHLPRQRGHSMRLANTLDCWLSLPSLPPSLDSPIPPPLLHMTVLVIETARHH
jgi:hypothetical protein